MDYSEPRGRRIGTREDPGAAPKVMINKVPEGYAPKVSLLNAHLSQEGHPHQSRILEKSASATSHPVPGTPRCPKFAHIPLVAGKRSKEKKQERA